MKMKELHVIYVPGLRDQRFINKLLIKIISLFWKAQGFKFHIISPRWEEGKSFLPKLKLITDKIDELSGKTVYLIGQSAGGSAVLNAYSQRKSEIAGVVNSTGRLRKGENVRPSLDHAARFSPAFKESVLLFENTNESTLTSKDRKKIVTIKPLWDETVPSSTVALKGATNITVPVVEHGFGGFFIVTLYSPVLAKLLKSF